MNNQAEELAAMAAIISSMFQAILGLYAIIVMCVVGICVQAWIILTCSTHIQAAFASTDGVFVDIIRRFRGHKSLNHQQNFAENCTDTLKPLDLGL